MTIDLCTDEELEAFGQICRWCFETRQRVIHGDQLAKKPSRQPRGSWQKQQERAAIDRVVWGKE